LGKGETKCFSLISLVGSRWGFRDNTENSKQGWSVTPPPVRAGDRCNFDSKRASPARNTLAEKPGGLQSWSAARPDAKLAFRYLAMVARPRTSVNIWVVEKIRYNVMKELDKIPAALDVDT